MSLKSPSIDIHLSDISSTIQSHDKPLHTSVHYLLSAHTPSFIPRVASGNNLNSLADGFHLTPNNPTAPYSTHSFSQLLSNSHLHDQVASEVDYSAYIGKQKHLFAHTPGTTYYHSQSLFSVSHKHLLSLCTLLFTLHWFNDGVFQSIVTSKSSSSYNALQSTLILSSSLISIVIFAPIIGYLARSYPPLRFLWSGFCIILLSTFITSISHSFTAMFCARLLMGIGEAFVIPIAPPLVLYTAPPAHKSLMLSIFLCSIPSGYSLGYFTASELLDSLPSFSMFNESWQRLFCWETIFLTPIVVYSWWKVKGPDSLIAMANYNIQTHNICDILTNVIYLGMVIGHTLQGFGCCILTMIVWNKLSQTTIMGGNGKGMNLDPYEIWSLSIFVLGTIGILTGGLCIDYFHNKSVFKANKKRQKHRNRNRNKATQTQDIEAIGADDANAEPHHKWSIAAISNIEEEIGDNAQNYSLGLDIANDDLHEKTTHSFPIKDKQRNINPSIPSMFLSKSVDAAWSQNFVSKQFSVNTDGVPNRKESIEQYKLRKFVENQQKKLSHIPPHIVQTEAPKPSFVALKKEQTEAAERRREKLKRKRQREHSRNKKKFKPITNLHTIRICLYKVIIPTSLLCFLCIILLYFFNDNFIAFSVLALFAQILTFIQISAIYTSMLWVIGLEWQCFGCGVAEIGFHLAGDSIAPGLISNLLLEDPFEFDLLVLIMTILISILIFFVAWKFVDFQIWNITKNNTKMFGLLYDETTYTTSTRTTTTKYHAEEYSTASSSYTSSNGTENSEFNDTENSSRYESQTNDYSEYESASDWNPGNY